jgi:hypothetical protein
VQATVTLQLVTSGNQASLQLTGVQNISVNLGDWPGVLEPVESAIEGILNSVVSLFQGQVSSAVSGISVNLFTLPSTLPGTSLPAQLAFAPNGLNVTGGAVQALIQVTAQ